MQRCSKALDKRISLGRRTLHQNAPSRHAYPRVFQRRRHPLRPGPDSS
jgi:hypothetical protein